MFGGEPCNSLILHGDKAQNSLSSLEGEMSRLVAAFRYLQCYTALLCCHCHRDLCMKFWLAAKIVEESCEGHV